VSQNRPTLNVMKTTYLKTNWLAPLLGVAVVGGCLLATTTYLDLARKVQAQEALGVTIDRLCADQKISAVLKAIHDGEVAAGVQRLDLLLCDSILRLDAELASADEQTRAYAADALRRIALLRPKRQLDAAGGLVQELSEDQAAAERILDRVQAGFHVAQTK
jgi:hypothetical protein